MSIAISLSSLWCTWHHIHHYIIKFTMEHIMSWAAMKGAMLCISSWHTLYHELLPNDMNIIISWTSWWLKWYHKLHHLTDDIMCFAIYHIMSFTHELILDNDMTSAKTWIFSHIIIELGWLSWRICSFCLRQRWKWNSKSWS